MSKHKLFPLCLLALAIAVVPSQLAASPITVGAGWYGFCFGDVGTAITAGCQNAGIGTVGDPVTFTAAGSVEFRITDAFQPGDRFQIVIDGGAPMLTSVPSGASAFTVDPNTAFADPAYSHLAVMLGSGAHTVNVTVAASPFGSGGGYLEVVGSSVPEPAAFGLLGGGLLLLGVLRRRRV